MTKRDKRIIIVGAGAFGCTTALELLNRGSYTVHMFERSDQVPAPDAASTDLQKCIRCDYGPNEQYTRMALESIKRWKEMDMDPSDIVNQPLFDQCGWLVLSGRPWTDAHFERNSWQQISEILEPNEFAREIIPFDNQMIQKFPALATNWKSDNLNYQSGYWNRLGGLVRSGKAVKRYLDVCLKRGMQLTVGDQGTVVKILVDRNGSDEIAGVETADGRQHWADRVIVCAGAWSASLIPELCPLIEAHGQPVIHLRIPEEMIERYSSPQMPAFAFDISNTGFYGFPVDPETGLLKVGLHTSGYINNGVSSSSSSGGVSLPCSLKDPHRMPKDAFEELKSCIRRYLPAELSNVAIHSARLCWYSDSFDGNFYIDHLPGSFERILIATGGSGYGFKFAPVLGELIADVLEGRPNEYAPLFRWRSANESLRGSTSERATSSTGGPVPLDCVDFVGI